MSSSIRFISPFVKNGIILLSVLRRMNYPLLRYYKSNELTVRQAWEQEGIKVLDDLHTLNTDENIRLYLLYHFGYQVDMSVLRKKDRTIYNYLLKRGKPREVVESFGFEPVTYAESSEEHLRSQLHQIADDGGRIAKIADKHLANKLLYRARKKGFRSSIDYLKSLGFTYGVDEDRVKVLLEAGKSTNEIAKLLQTSWQTAKRVIEKVKVH